MPGMRTTFWVVALLGIVGCGGKVTEASGDTGGSPSRSFDSGAGSGDGGTIGSGTVDGETSGSEVGAKDAAVVCSLPPASGDQCTFCNNQWYCPQSQSPEPPCAPNPKLYGPCTGSYCVVCADGSVTMWACNAGAQPPMYATYWGTQYSCSP
jgi:hypothetical protein